MMISLVPFRSSWKYGLRAWRYLYLDLGHQIGSLSASVEHFGLTLTKMFPQEGLNPIMGMGKEEVIAAAYGIGELSSRTVAPLRTALMRVAPTDYTMIEDTLYAALPSEPITTKIAKGVFRESFLQINGARRSAREFYPPAMGDDVIRELLNLTAPSNLEIVAILLQAQCMQPGVYRNGKCAVKGNFVTECVHLLLDQRFIAGANMVLLIYAENFSASAHVEAGIYAQELYSTCEYHGIGCSGIGAFYDEEASLWSQRLLLYAVAVGGKI
jgi:hypothetical protein